MNRIAAVKIGNGARHLEDAGVSTGRETKTVGDQFQHPVAGRVQLAIFFDETGCHLRVAVDFCAFVALQLKLSRTLDPPGNRRRPFRLTPVSQIAIFYRRHFNVDVDPVQKRPGDAGTVAMDRDRRAAAGVGRIGQVTARAWVHRRYQHHARRIGQREERAGNGDPAILDRLPENFECVFLEFRLGNSNIANTFLQLSAYPTSIRVKQLKIPCHIPSIYTLLYDRPIRKSN